jgi:hypothetical protein
MKRCRQRLRSGSSPLPTDITGKEASQAEMRAMLPCARRIAATGAIERRLARAELVSLPMQGWLVFFDLNDQADIGVIGDLGCFCSVKASSVTRWRASAR